MNQLRPFVSVPRVRGRAVSKEITGVGPRADPERVFHPGTGSVNHKGTSGGERGLVRAGGKSQAGNVVVTG